MLIISSLFALLVAIAGWLVVGGEYRNRVAMLLLMAAFPTAFALYAFHLPPLVKDRPIRALADGYVGSGSCRSCHPGNHASWHASYHRTMTQVPTTESVLADFDGSEVQIEGRTFRLFRKSDEFWVELPGDGGSRVHRKVVLVTGSHHMQIYWMWAENARKLVYFPIVYLIDEQRWIPRNSAFIEPTLCAVKRYEELPNALWNKVCMRCHATHGRQDKQFDTKVAEFGIACEACHGPGETHVAANRSPLKRYSQHLSDKPDPTIVNPARLDPQRASHTCGQCHSVNHFDSLASYQAWVDNGWRYRPGDDLHATREILTPAKKDTEAGRALLQGNPRYFDGIFWNDGMVRVSGREYSGLIQSPCHQRGELSCLSCHAMHQPKDDPRPVREWANDQLKPGMDGNRACVQCHQAISGDIAAHTHHATDSAGSNCYNCHMPHTTYGLLKAIRSHQIDSPNVAVTRKTGRPNACNLCHLDKTLSWTADHLTDWYGHDDVDLDYDERKTSAALLSMYKGDAAQRATVAWSLGWSPAKEASGSDWIAPHLGVLLDDPYDAVRFVAFRSLRGLPGFASFEYDFIAPADQRAEAVGRAMQAWQSQGVRPTQRELLFRPDGVFDSRKQRQLLEQRDDTPIQIIE